MVGVATVVTCRDESKQQRIHSSNKLIGLLIRDFTSSKSRTCNELMYIICIPIEKLWDVVRRIVQSHTQYSVGSRTSQRFILYYSSVSTLGTTCATCDISYRRLQRFDFQHQSCRKIII